MSSATASTPTNTTTNVVLKRSLPFSSFTTATPRRLLKNPFGEIQQVKLILMRFANLLSIVMNNNFWPDAFLVQSFPFKAASNSCNLLNAFKPYSSAMTINKM